MSPWLELKLCSLSEAVLATWDQAAQSLAQKGAKALTVLMNALRGANLAPAGAHIRRITATTEHQQGDLDKLLELLHAEGGLRLARTPRELRLSWDARAQAVCMDSLSTGSQQPVDAFCVEISRGEEVLWSGDSQEGRLSIPLAKLARALEEGADRLLIMALQEPG